MVANEFKKDERVRIVGGSYVSHGFGIYLRKAGKTKVAVRIDNDSVSERNLMRSSIERIKPTEQTTEQDDVCISRQEHKQLVEMAARAKADIEKLKNEIDRLNEKLAAVGLE